MPKNGVKQYPKRKKPEEVVKILAEKYGVTRRLVQMVISGDVNRPDILDDYMEYLEKHNELLKSVKKVAPILN